MPLTGWAMVSASTKPRPIAWFGLIDVPFLPVTKPNAGTAHALHETLGLLFARLVLLYIAGALSPHMLLKDGGLARRLPGLPPSRVALAWACARERYPTRHPPQTHF